MGHGTATQPRQFVIHWLQEDGTSYSTVAIEAEDFVAATWEATRRLRSILKGNRRAIEHGLYGRGFRVEESV